MDLPPAETSALRWIGDYELLEEIARGGMGIVYRARQISLNRQVAVKLMRDSALANPEEVRRFRVEALAAAKLKHPNIVAIHEVDEDQGQHYFAMDLIEGMNLSQRTREGPLTPGNAADLVATVANAVQHAHEQGILHRDLKPSNVLMDAAGKPFVTDFGLARPLDTDSDLTVTGQILGTPSYMPPEQATSDGAVGPAADIYSLGAMLYHLLTGRAPFVGGTTAETLRHVIEQEPVSPQLLNPEVPRDLASVCLKCLSKRPTDRYASASDLSADLRRFVRGEPTLARPTGQTERLWRWCRRKPALATAIATIMLVGIAGLAGVLWQWRHARTETARALRNAYVADMNLANQTLAEGDLGRTVELLDRYRSGFGKDSRGWEWRYLWQRTRSHERMTIGQHSDLVSTLAFTPDGSFLASGSHDGTARFWNTTNWSEIRQLKLPTRVRSLALSPDGRTMAAGTLDWKVTVWDWKNGEQRTAFSLPVGYQEGALTFTPDGTALVSGSRKGLLEIRLTNDYQVVQRLVGHQGWIHVLAFSSDGKTMASGGDDRTIRLWDSKTWELNATLPAPIHGSRVNTISFSPDGRRLLTSGLEPTVKLWDLDSFGQILSFDGHAGKTVNAAAFSPNGKLMVTASSGQTIGIWDASDGHEIARLQGHEDKVIALAFSPDGKSLVSGDRDGWLKVWDPTGSQVTNQFLPLASGMFESGISRDGGMVFAQYPHAIEVWDTLECRKVGEIPVTGTSIKGVYNSASNGRHLALGTTDGQVQIFALHPLGPTETLSGLHVKDVDAVAFSFDSRFVASVDFAGQVQVRDRETQQKLAQWKVPSGICSPAFAPDGRLVAIGSGDGSVALGRIGESRLLARLTRQRETVPGVDFTRAVSCLAFSPDGRVLAVGSSDGRTILWDVSSHRRLLTLRGYRTSVSSIAFTSDASRLATGSGNGAIKIWDLVSEQEIITLKGHIGKTCVAFLQDDETLMSTRAF